MPETPPLEDLVEFPSTFTFRVVATSSDGLADRAAALVSDAVGRSHDTVEEQPSKNGNYRSVRVAVLVESAEEIRAAYAALKTIPGVKMLL